MKRFLIDDPRGREFVVTVEGSWDNGKYHYEVSELKTAVKNAAVKAKNKWVASLAFDGWHEPEDILRFIYGSVRIRPMPGNFVTDEPG